MPVVQFHLSSTCKNTSAYFSNQLAQNFSLSKSHAVTFLFICIAILSPLFIHTCSYCAQVWFRGMLLIFLFLAALND